MGKKAKTNMASQKKKKEWETVNSHYSLTKEYNLKKKKKKHLSRSRPHLKRIAVRIENKTSETES